MGLSQDLLKKIANAKATVGGDNIRDGKYRFAIKNLLIEEGFKGTCFKAEFEVVSSQKTMEDTEPNAVGTCPSYVVNLSTNRSAAGNVKQFVLGLLGISEKDPEATEDNIMKTVAELVGPSQPARGMLIDDATYRKIIKTGDNAGKPFTGHNWSHVSQSKPEIAALRKKLEAA